MERQTDAFDPKLSRMLLACSRLSPKSPRYALRVSFRIPERLGVRNGLCALTFLSIFLEIDRPPDAKAKRPVVALVTGFGTVDSTVTGLPASQRLLANDP